MKKMLLLALAIVVGVAAVMGGCSRRPIRAGQADLLQLAQSRGLTPEDATRALKTFVPPGGRDEYLLFASGGHSGQVHVIGVPSMRLLKTVAVFTPEPWQGYGYGADWSESALNGGSNPDPAEHLRWGDSHHPALSETDGKYDGRWLYINDRAHGRIGMIDLADFRAKQVLHVPNLQTSHGGIFATPDTRYVHISSKVPALKAWNAAKGQRVTLDDHLNRYADIYRGYSTFISVDQTTGHMKLDESFQIELPPYTQDLADAGKGVSYGYAFINSYNAEMSTGGIEQGKPPIEVGASQLDFDYLHIINWKKAEDVRRRGQVPDDQRHPRHLARDRRRRRAALSRTRAQQSARRGRHARRGLHHRLGQARSARDRLRLRRIEKAIDAKNFEGKDRYGIPILEFDAVVAGKVELGPGPLHTQYDNQGNAYTCLYLESAVAKWTLGEPYHPATRRSSRRQDLGSLQHRPPRRRRRATRWIPHGKYLIAMNKWSIDRHTKLGPLLPQNFQLIDISGEKMQLARRHADRLRRTALRADGQGRQGQAARRLPAGRVAGLDDEEPQRDRGRQGGADRAAPRRRGSLDERRAQPLHAGHRPPRRPATR